MQKLTNILKGLGVMAGLTLALYGTTEIWPQQFYRSKLLSAEAARLQRGGSV